MAQYRSNPEKIHRNRGLIAIGLLYNLGLLGYYKYTNFFIESAMAFLLRLGFQPHWGVLEIAMPIGLSFYTFSVVGYLLEVYWGRKAAAVNMLCFATYVAFFPKLIAGPIERYHDFEPQIRAPKVAGDNIDNGLQLLLIGYLKKVAIADIIATKIATFYENPLAFSPTDAFFVIVLYTIQIYADFSGYSDIARGVASLLGIRLMTNFAQPYLSTNPQDFWRTWHISLSTWFRDYLYIPLGGNRKGKARGYLNLVIVMTVAGLWHGAGMNFIIWGFFHGVLLVVTHAIKSRKRMFQNPATTPKTPYSFFSFIKTPFFLLLNMFFVSVLWVFFRVAEFQTAIDIIGHGYAFWRWSAAGIWQNSYFSHIFFALLFLVPIDLAQRHYRKEEFFGELHWVLQALLYTLLIVTVLMFKVEIVPPFIYQGF